MSPRAPYGSKLIKVLLAALDLYEFTQTQLINYAGEDISVADFENAKREGAPLELGKVLIEQGVTAKVSRSGRPQKIYTFRNPTEYDELRAWVNIFRLDLGDGTPRIIKSSEQIATPSNEYVNGNLTELSDLDEKVSQILLFLMRQDVPRTELVVWSERALRYISEWISQYNLLNGVVESAAEITQKIIKLQIQSFQGRLYLLTFEERLDFSKRIEYLFGLLNELLNYCIDNKQSLEKVRYFGFLDVGLRLMDNLSSVQKDYLEQSALINKYSTTWVRGQWEEFHNHIQSIFQGQDNQLAQSLYRYWLGCYGTAITEIGQSEKNVLPEILKRLSRKPNPTDELLRTLEELNLPYSNM